ncbi:MAG: hypothetical protein QM758_29925 [Armatimonas sp.]
MKRFLLIVSSLILIGIALFTAWYLKTKAKNEFYAKRYLEYDVWIFSQEAEQRSLERRKTYIAKLIDIRAKYRTDIARHKDEVKQILANRDRKHYEKIFTIIPSRSPYKLIDKKDFQLGKGFDQTKYGFTWQLFRPSAPELKMDKFSYNPYREKGDVPLAYSLGAGRKKLTLWLSGRITETTMADNPALKIRPLKGPTPAYIDIEEEIEPAFDFLKP